MDGDKKPESKSVGAQTVINILLVIVCCVIFGLFVHDYLGKNAELAKYKQREHEWVESTKARKKAVVRLAGLYKEKLKNNASIEADGQDLPPDEQARVEKEIAKHVSANLNPILVELDKDKNLTNEKLDKITDDLVAMLARETKKSEQIRKEMAREMKNQRVSQQAREDKLRRELEDTRAVFTDLYGLAARLKTLYVDAHEDDSVLGNIGTAAMAPVKVVQNTLSLNLAFGRDKARADREFQKKLDKIKKRYKAIVDKRGVAEPEIKNDGKKRE